ncbi:hypothetical protein N9L24_04660, partial [Candidatus Marinamargulisbacteria bacterium]|nr:hypothetical protein [Candidatus Marinamargulisbacteria bacterium]
SDLYSCGALPIGVSMLTYLRIQDFVIIESCELSYGDGFTVLTGDCGGCTGLALGQNRGR